MHTTPDTPLVRLEAELAQARAERDFIASLIDGLPGGVAFLDRDLVFRWLNPAYARFFDLAVDDFLGRPLLALIPGANADGLRRVIETGEPWKATAHRFTLASVERYWDFEVKGVRGPAGEVVGALVMIVDVTERVRLSAIAEAQRDLTARIVQNAPSGISYLNRDLVYEWVNPTQATLWGIPAERAVGRSVFEVFGLADDAEVGRLLRGVLATGEPYKGTDFPFTYMLDGEPRTTIWDFVYQPVAGPDGAVAGVLVTANEITERKRSVAVLQESEERFRGLFEASQDAIVTATFERGVIDLNPAFTRLFGYTLDEMRGQSTARLYLSQEAYLAAGRQATSDMARQEPVTFETEMRRKDGSVVPIEATSYLLHDAEGRPHRLVGVLRDLTERKRTERQQALHTRELAAQKAFAENLVQNIPTGVAYLDRDLVFRVVNPVYAGFVQVPAADLVDRYLFDALPAERSQIEPILLDVLATGKPFYGREFPFVYTLPDGTERTSYWDFVYYPVRASEDEPVQGVFALADEVSERLAQQSEQRRMREEQERLQRERLEALEQSDRLKDQFLSILSHELRTPINAIMGFGSVLDDGVLGPMSADQHAYLGKILASADDLLVLIEDLLIVSRVQAGKFSVSPQPCRFDALVADVLETQAPEASRKGIALASQVPSALPALHADPLRVTQVLNNLVGNAIKFTRAGGRVDIRARVEGGALRCEVADTGIGIAADDVPKLFQRFSQVDMSATRAANGVGLGLSIVKAIVEAHGGTAGVESQPERGSTFWFVLPLGA